MWALLIIIGFLTVCIIDGIVSDIRDYRQKMIELSDFSVLDTEFNAKIEEVYKHEKG